MKNIGIIIITILLFSSCSGTKMKDEKQVYVLNNHSVVLTDAQIKSANIITGKIEKRSICSTIKLNGKIDVPPQNLVSVSMPLGGYLKSTNLLPGMHIKKGEVIATLEDQQYIQLQQEYLSAKAKLTFLEGEYNRQKELNKSKASSDKIYQQTDMDFKTQRIAMSALAEKLKLININPETLSENNLSRSVNLYSSIDGFVSKVNVNIGKYVTPSDVLFELINPTDIHLNLQVFEKDLDKLNIGQKLLAYNNSEPYKKHPCEIILISQDLSADRTADVHCHFEDYDKSLFPGMYMNADIEIKNDSISSINEEALVNFEGKDYVFVRTDVNHFELVEVTKGISQNNFTAISSSNLRNISFTNIVIKGAYSLLMQQKNKSNVEE